MNSGTCSGVTSNWPFGLFIALAIFANAGAGRRGDAPGHALPYTMTPGVEPLLALDPEARTGCVIVVGGTSAAASSSSIGM